MKKTEEKRNYYPNETEREIELLAEVIPALVINTAWLERYPEAYYSRLSGFGIGFCYGGWNEITTGQLAELWKQGLMRDGECFYYGCTGGFSGCRLWGVNLRTGQSCATRARSDVQWQIRAKLFDPDKEMRTVFPPGKSSKVKSFSAMANSLLSDKGAVEASQIPLPLPSTCLNVFDYWGFELNDSSEYIRVRGGEFLMGRQKKRCGLGSIHPGSKVRVEGFEIMAEPVGNDLLRSISFKQKHDDNSQASLTWHECKAVAQAMTRRDPRYDYRLPSAAEWEYAALCVLSEKQRRPQVALLGNDCCLESNVPLDKLERFGSACTEWCEDQYEPMYENADVRYRRTGPGHRLLKGGGQLPAKSFGQVPWCTGDLFSKPSSCRLVRSPKGV